MSQYVAFARTFLTLFLLCFLLHFTIIRNKKNYFLLAPPLASLDIVIYVQTSVSLPLLATIVATTLCGRSLVIAQKYSAKEIAVLTKIWFVYSVVTL